MRSTHLLLVLGLVLGSHRAPAAEPEFPLTEDSLPHDGVPKGELIKGTYTAKDGSVFPGTERDYTIYLPPKDNSRSRDTPVPEPQNKRDTPVPANNQLPDKDKSVPTSMPFMVFQDGVIYNAPTVFDNLIAKKQIPPLIGIFIKPGVVPAANDNALPRYNRSYEYDSVTDTYSRFLLDELLPALEERHHLKFSTDPNDAAIAGNSSGGICAFMAAWHRPDRIRRVFSGVGTYVGIHGADQLPVLIRKYEPRPLRIYLQSGTGDNNLYCGDWWMANQTMERALIWAGYDVAHTWGEGGHNAKHPTQIFPDVMRWLWRDCATAKEIKPNPRGESKWKGYEVIGDGKWEVIRDRGQVVPDKTDDLISLTPILNGEVLVPLSEGEKVCRISISGEFEPMIDKVHTPSRVTATKNGDLYIHSISDQAVSNQLTRISRDGTRKDMLLQVYHDQIIVENSGRAYVVDGRNIWSVDLDTYNPAKLGWNDDHQIYEMPEMYNLDGIMSAALSPDQTLIYSTCRMSPFIFSHRLNGLDHMAFSQSYGVLEVPPGGTAEARGLCVDTNGWLYVATALGIQVCDQAGRVNFIIPTPQPPHDVCFGGKDLGELFIACGDKIYKRPTKAHGYISGQMAPIKPPAPKL